jgi:hypothetical protein
LEWCWQKPRKYQKVGEKTEINPSLGNIAWLTPWFQTSGLQISETMNFYCFKPPSLWYLAIATQETNRHNFIISWIRIHYNKESGFCLK